MRFMVIVQGCGPGKTVSREFLAAMGKYNEDLAKAGVLLALEGLVPSSEATTVKFSGTTRIVLDGPFTEAKESIGGFWLWKCKSKQEALDWLKRAPFDDKAVELRQVLDPEDFIENFKREFRAQEERDRANVGAQK